MEPAGAPPRLARLLLAAALPAEVRADVLHDMHAIWARRARASRWDADRWYRRHVRASLTDALRARLRPASDPETDRTSIPARGDGIVRTTLQDIGYAARWARLNPAFTAVVLLTLALGIGANTAMFSVVYGVLFSPLPYPDGDRIVRFYNTNDRAHESQQSLSIVELAEYLDRQDMFEAMGGLDVYPVTLTGGDEPVRVRATVVTGGFFESLAMPAQRGRTFTAGETEPGGDPVVVISDGLWRRAFGGRDGVVGTDLGVDGVTRRIVGVMPPDFDFYPDSDVWLPMPIDRATLSSDRIRSHGLVAIARLRAGADLARTQESADRMVEGVIEQYPQHDGYHAALLVPLSSWFTGSVRPMLLTLLGGVGFMLLIVCANIAALLLTRAESRRREIAIRAALGAGQRRLVRQLLTESLTLALVGGLLGILVAYLARDLVATQLAAGLPRSQEVALSWPVLLFSIGVSVFTGVLFGLAPALQVAGQRMGDVLRGSRAGVAPGRQRARGLLVTAEVALVVALLMGTALIGRSFVNLIGVEPGIEPEGVLAFDVELPGAGYPTHADVARTFDALTERLRGLPGVGAVGAVSWLPFADFPSQWGVEIDGVEIPEEAELPDWTVVAGDYFDAVGLPITSGRGLRADDRETGAVVTVGAAELYWPDGNPLGQRIRLEGQPAWRTVVGVVGDFKNRGLSTPPRHGLYLPHFPIDFGNEWYPRRMSFTISAAGGDSMALVSTVRDVVWSVDADLPLGRLQPLKAVLEQQTASTRVTAMLLACFAALGLGLAAVGIHGVVAQSVAAGQREIGIRLALGARAQRVLREVVTASMLRVGAGLAVGLLLGFWLTGSLMSTLLFDVTSSDPMIWAVVVGVLGLVGLVATLVPARRALRVDPATVLRID